jgi:hypothetical protein
MIDGIGGIVVFVSNQVKAIEFYKNLNIEYSTFAVYLSLLLEMNVSPI